MSLTITRRKIESNMVTSNSADIAIFMILSMTFIEINHLAFNHRITPILTKQQLKYKEPQKDI